MPHCASVHPLETDIGQISGSHPHVCAKVCNQFQDHHLSLWCLCESAFNTCPVFWPEKLGAFGYIPLLIWAKYKSWSKKKHSQALHWAASYSRSSIREWNTLCLIVRRYFSLHTVSTSKSFILHLPKQETKQENGHTKVWQIKWRKKMNGIKTLIF